MDAKSDTDNYYDNIVFEHESRQLNLTSQKNHDPVYWTIESSNSRINTQNFNDQNQSQNVICDSVDERTVTFKTLRESLLGDPTQRADSSTVKKIRERVHLDLIKKTPSPLGKALVTLTTESVKG